MARFVKKTPKSELSDNGPFTLYFPHTEKHKKKERDYIQFFSVDPAKINFCIRVERRYNFGKIVPIAFDKTAVEESFMKNYNGVNIVTSKTYENINTFLDKYSEFFEDCDYFIVERQLPINYKSTRISQHTISYFCDKTKNMPLLPEIIEICPRLKGKLLKVPKNINEKALKAWTVSIARRILKLRGDDFSIGVMDYFSKKQDDLADTVCQIEAFCMYVGLPTTQGLVLKNEDVLVNFLFE